MGGKTNNKSILRGGEPRGVVLQSRDGGKKIENFPSDMTRAITRLHDGRQGTGGPREKGNSMKRSLRRQEFHRGLSGTIEDNPATGHKRHGRKGVQESCNAI